VVGGGVWQSIGADDWLRNCRDAMHDDDIKRAVLATIESIAPEAGFPGLRPDRPLREQVDLDSMDWLNVVCALHEKLAIEIPESDYGQLATLDSAVAYLASRQAQAGAGPARASAAAPPPSGTSHWINGTAVRVRPMRRDDLPMEADFVRHLSSETRYKRFMLTLRELSPEKLKYLTDVDQVRHVALVATVEGRERETEIGVARYVVDPAGTGCEFAIAVDDAWQGSGVAGVLMQALIATARGRGLATMEGIVLRTNTRMLRFSRQLGFEARPDPEDLQTVRVVRAL
jgi:acetyltransferase